MDVNLTTIRPNGFVHVSAFNELKESLGWALSALGYEVAVTENTIMQDVRNIVFGAETFSDTQAELPAGTIVYNLEQPTHPRMDNVRRVAKNCQVWDYSARNIETWKKQGFDVRHVPVGYTPNLTRIPKAEMQDIDVLFYGFLTPRRRKIIQDLTDAGLRVFYTDSCYGGARDNLISRAKVVLNIHHDGRDMFEIVRVSYLLANSKCVSTEISSDDDSYKELKGTISRSPFSGIVDDCMELVKHESVRVAHEDAAMHFSKQDYTATVACALAVGRHDQAVNSLYESANRVFTNHTIESRYERGCREGDMKDFLPWIRENARGNILEIGVRDGASTSAFLLGIEEHRGRLYSVDIKDCSHLFKGHPQWTFRQLDSKNLDGPDDSFDIALIDGDHSREGYLTDLKNCFLWVRNGGIILSHDISPSKTCEEYGGDWPSKAIGEEYFKFCREKGLVHFELPGENGMGVMVVRK